MLSVKRNFISDRYIFWDEKKTVGILKTPLFRQTAYFSGKEGDFLFSREKLFEGAFILADKENTSIIRANKPRGTGLEYTLKYNQQQYSLYPGELFYSRRLPHYELHMDDKLLGTVIRDLKLFRYLISIEEDIPPVVQIFIFWLSLQAWKGERGWRAARICH